MTPIAPPRAAVVAVPGSRSITNRALVCAALAEGRSTLRGWLDADDTRAMRDGLVHMGVSISERAGALVVEGTAGRFSARAAHIDCGASGTTMRFLTAVAAISGDEVVLDGTPRARQRPIGPLADALHALGAKVVTHEGFPPVRVHERAIHGGAVTLDAADSGQFLSALLMVAPYASAPVEITTPTIASRPFVDMTIDVMRAFGVAVAEPTPNVFELRPARYVACTYEIEPDVMSAGYFFAAAAVTGGSVTVRGIGPGSIQGDIGFVEILTQMGCSTDATETGMTVVGTDALRGVDVDMNAMPDMALTLAVVACFARGTTTIRGIHHLRHKETDRLAALNAELTKLGARVVVGDATLTIDPPAVVQPARIATYDDHRMAMSFAIAGLRAPGIEIEDPACVAKTYPRFFEDLDQLT